MKIAVFGATGLCGKNLVEVALNDGYGVKALIRNPTKLDHIKHENLEIVKIDIFDVDAVSKQLEDVDAILSCLGGLPTWRWKKETVYSTSIEAIAKAARKANKKRIIALTGARQVPDPEGREGWFIRNFDWIVMRPIMDDMMRMESYLKENCQDLDYTVLRPTGFCKTEPWTGEAIIIPDVYFRPEDSLWIPYKKVVLLMLEALKENKWVKEHVYCAMPNGFDKVEK